ncbi:MAG: autotransporter outer membrane beta-barrel domain-containing protein [Acidobacteriaceae bacterium]|nr:autotransporter outer membrane beta-barrel domain-containing protein [Acidobacteriaceae bacterium]
MATVLAVASPAHAQHTATGNATAASTTMTPLPPGLDTNQKSVATALMNVFNATGEIPLAFDALSPESLTHVSGEVATGVSRVGINVMQQFLSVIADPMVEGWIVCDTPSDSPRRKEQCETKSWTPWVAPYAGVRTSTGDAGDGTHDVTSHVWGLAAGADYRISPNTLVGVALGSAGTNVRLANDLGTSRSTVVQLGTFAHHTLGHASVTGALAYDRQDVTTDRTVTITGTDQLHALFYTNTVSGRLEGDYRIAVGAIDLLPYAAGRFTKQMLPAYTETASAGAETFALAYASTAATDRRAELGLRTETTHVADNGGVFTLGGRLAWARNVNPAPHTTASFQALPGSTFTIDGVSIGRDATLATVAMGMAWTNRWTLVGSFDSAFSSASRTYVGKGLLRYRW